MEIQINLNLDGQIIVAIKNTDKKYQKAETLLDKVITDEKATKQLEQINQNWWYNTDRIKIVKL